MKNFRIVFLAVITATVFLGSCKKDKDQDFRKVEYRVKAKAASIDRIFYTDETGVQKFAGGITSDAWSSGEIVIPNSINKLIITAEGTDNNINLSSLTVQIYVNGELKSELIDTDDDRNQFVATTSF